jgi:acetoin utilization deacetylase AcuC-like enzyme
MPRVTQRRSVVEAHGSDYVRSMIARCESAVRETATSGTRVSAVLPNGVPRMSAPIDDASWH